MAAAQVVKHTTQGHHSFSREESEIKRPSRATIQLHQVQSGACRTPAGETMATGTQERKSAARLIPINHMATLSLDLLLMCVQEHYTVIWRAFILKC